VFGQSGGDDAGISGPIIIGPGNSGNTDPGNTNTESNTDPGSTGNTSDARPTALPPTPSPEKTDDPFPSNPGGLGRLELPFGGAISLIGETPVNNATEFTFTPNLTGLWVIYTGNNGGSDPMLAMYEPDDTLIIQNDDALPGYNSEVTEYLVSGTTYYVQALFYGGPSGRCSIFVKPPETIPAAGGSINVTASQGYLFTPSQSGTWEFRTSNNGTFDPFLIIYDQSGVIIGSDDDSAGDSNAILILDLTAGETYDIYAGFYQEGPAKYTLNVVRR